jgi:hypothetical protein
MEYVQVVRKDLLEYVAYVEQLLEHHNQLEEQHKDLLEVTAIQSASNKARLEALTDHILDNNSNKDYAQGLLDAYLIIKQGVINNG